MAETKRLGCSRVHGRGQADQVVILTGIEHCELLPGGRDSPPLCPQGCGAAAPAAAPRPHGVPARRPLRMPWAERQPAAASWRCGRRSGGSDHEQANRTSDRHGVVARRRTTQCVARTPALARRSNPTRLRRQKPGQSCWLVLFRTVGNPQTLH